MVMVMVIAFIIALNTAMYAFIGAVQNNSHTSIHSGPQTHKLTFNMLWKIRWQYDRYCRNVLRYRYVFIWVLNEARLVIFLSLSGRAFHKRGPATLIDLSAKLEHRTCKHFVVDALVNQPVL